MSFASARRYVRCRQKLSLLIDQWAEPIASRLGLCGHGPRRNASILLADIVFVDCPCCMAWRTFLFGVGTALVLSSVLGPWSAVAVCAAVVVVRMGWVAFYRWTEVHV